jgi:N-acetylglucosaminyldiphosphoundecaprenol N-acetyl-beta-D-mannosaminyltransferase
VGLSTPKQEKWMYEHRHCLEVPVMLGVGAAFDMNSGMSCRAPRWMREGGLEWLYRLSSDPLRLWRRYLVTIPKAAWFVCLELLGFWIWTFAQGEGGGKSAPKSTEESSVS